MRRILIDYAKQRQTQKRGAGTPLLPLDAAHGVASSGELSDMEADDLVALDDALNRLAAFNPQGARIIQYRFFGGLTNEEIAELLGTSERSVRRAWTVAKGWLRRELGASLDRSAGPQDDDVLPV
jgi:RNA polymerase sigma factor (TIGR02999 family)